MKKINVHSLLIIAASIILLSSCSQVRQVTSSSNHKLHLIKADRNASTTAKAVSPKATEKKELNSLPAKNQEISGLQVEKNSDPELQPAKSSVIDPSNSKESKTNSKTGFADKKFEQIKKVIERIPAINDLTKSIQSEKKLLPYGHSDASKYLKLWLIFLGGAILFSILLVVSLSGVESGEGIGVAIIFYILAFACYVLFVVFWIIWLVKLFS